MDSHTNNHILSKFACDLELNIGRMIHNQDVNAAKPSTLCQERERPTSSLGLLDAIPAELLLLILNLLDFQSLSRVSRVCFRGKIIVESLSPYRQVMQHAPTILTALTKTNLISRYPASLILHALQTYHCVSCLDFGAFLYLPTCERVCLECLNQNRGLWMITTATARKCFGLTQRQLQTIPIMRSIPGTYSVRTLEKTHRKLYQLVSVRHAKQLGLDVHGSPEKLAEFMPSTPARGERSRKFYEFKRYHEAPLEPPGRDMSKLPQKANIGNDHFAGMASLRVPYISGSGADWGYLCRGCQVTYRHFGHGSLPSAVLSELCPPGMCPDRPLFALTTRFYSHEGLLNHIEDCYGIQQILRREEPT
ncbi:hypothetical protein F53441_7210 [Fusarium austroafricanum]|uniref:F-box domain-containing protein n=1 Tax=Fusarium austroafricanum TaxID=2364996 RepID=A0A8H4NYP6_9HYPO|nr:hypothetical protein F53441_7210 [Fusarium austroafricanum]